MSTDDRNLAWGAFIAASGLALLVSLTVAVYQVATGQTPAQLLRARVDRLEERVKALERRR